MAASGIETTEVCKDIELYKKEVNEVCLTKTEEPVIEPFKTLTVDTLVELQCYKKFKAPKSQLQYYLEQGAPEPILRYVRLNGKTFGQKHMEQIAREYFNLGPPTSTIHDHTKLGKTIEQKSARYHANGSDWKWQHIEMSHDWDYLLVTGLDIHCIRFFIASRTMVEVMIKEGIITGQGKKDKDGVAKPQQAYWFSRSDFKKLGKKFDDYFTEIMCEKDIVAYLSV